MSTPLHVTLAAPVHLLVLIGGGEFSFGDTRAIDEFLVGQMPSDRRTIAFLPTASGSPEYGRHLGAYFKEIDPSLEVINVPVYRGRDGRRPKNVEQISKAGMVYLGGGVTNQLLDTIRESPVDMTMRDAATSGTVIAAIGAAASCFGTYARDMRGTTPSVAGLGWLDHTVIDTGFAVEDDVMLRRLMSLPETELGLGIPAGTALAIRGDGSTELVGSGVVAAFRRKPA
jgi:cyanophycinase-like exopeptidase